MPQGAGDTVVEMFRHELRDDHAGAMELMHSDVVVKPHDSDEMLYGRDAMERLRESRPKEFRDAEWMPLSLYEDGDTVLVHGYARIERPQADGSTAVEYMTPCWVFRVADGKITSIAVYTTLTEGVNASGITPGPEGKRQLGASGWLFARVAGRIASALGRRPVLAPG